MKAIVLPKIAPIEDQPLREIERPTPTPRENALCGFVSTSRACHCKSAHMKRRTFASKAISVLRPTSARIAWT